MKDMKTFYEQTLNAAKKTREIPRITPVVSENGVIFGRFQILHLGHAEYILGAKVRCKKLFIGIDVPDSSYLWRYEKQEEEKEPVVLTYYERLEMVRRVMKEFGVPEEDYEIVPFPVEDRKALFDYVPYDAAFYTIVFDGQEDERARMLREYGCNVVVLTNKQSGDAAASASEVRKALAGGDEYRSLVPRSVYDYMKEYHLEERFRDGAPKSL